MGLKSLGLECPVTSNKVLNVSNSMNWGVHMYQGPKIQMDASKAMGKKLFYFNILQNTTLCLIQDIKTLIYYSIK